MSAAYRGYDISLRLGPGKPSIHACARGFVIEPSRVKSTRSIHLNDQSQIEGLF